MKTEWCRPDSLYPQPLAGDIIQFKRVKFLDGELYKHVGIADGAGNVYHFSPGSGSSKSMKSGAFWQKQPIYKVAKGKSRYISKIRINNHRGDKKYRPRDQDEIIASCEEAFIYGVGDYDAVSNNCEHNANKMRYGFPWSKQVKRAVKGGSTAVGVVGLAIGAYALSRLIDSDSE